MAWKVVRQVRRYGTSGRTSRSRVVVRRRLLPTVEPSTTPGRLTQLAVEVLRDGSPAGRATQVVVEVLRSTATFLPAWAAGNSRVLTGGVV